MRSTGSSERTPDRLADVAAIARAREERPWRYYAPVPRVRETFHASDAVYRLLHGPNGGGKTWAGAAELVCYATGYNHFRDEHYPIPNRCWAVCLDRVNQQPVMMRALERMLPKGWKWHEKAQKYTLPAPWGSEIYIKSIDPGDVGKFQSDRILAAWFDEEWPGENGLQIWKETMRRTQPGWPLRLYMTLTPTRGFTWSYDYLRRPGPKRFIGTENHNFTIYDCAVEKGGFLTQEDIEREEKKCQSASERQIRLYGEYADIGMNPAFPGDQLLRAMERAMPGQPHRIRMVEHVGGMKIPLVEPDPEGDFIILVKPKAGRRYILGADPGMGVGQDNSAAAILDCDLPIECAYFVKNTIPPAEFAMRVIAPLATYYNEALAAVESNSSAGGACLAVLPSVYSHIHMRQNFMRIPGQPGGQFRKEYGFFTDAHSRGLIWSTYREILPMENFIVSEHLVRELMSLQASGDRIDHPEGGHDDHSMGFGIAAAVNRTNPPIRYRPWEEYREEYRGARAWMGY